MEKFAERYCRDNPGAFWTADGAYLLAFALIMLNTDAHNPQADKKLALEDFINMCQVQVSNLLAIPSLGRMYSQVEPSQNLDGSCHSNDLKPCSSWTPALPMAIRHLR